MAYCQRLPHSITSELHVTCSLLDLLPMQSPTRHVGQSLLWEASFACEMLVHAASRHCAKRYTRGHGLYPADNSHYHSLECQSKTSEEDPPLSCFLHWRVELCVFRLQRAGSAEHRPRHHLYVFSYMTSKGADRSLDGYTTLLAWTVVDLTLAVVVASLPVLSALVPALVRELTESSGIFGTIRPSAGTNRMTTSAAASTDRQASADSDEGGILCEHEIELSYSVDQTKDILESGSYITTQTNGIYIDRKHGNDSGLVV